MGNYEIMVGELNLLTKDEAKLFNGTHLKDLFIENQNEQTILQLCIKDDKGYYHDFFPIGIILNGAEQSSESKINLFFELNHTSWNLYGSGAVVPHYLHEALREELAKYPVDYRIESSEPHKLCTIVPGSIMVDENENLKDIFNKIELISEQIYYRAREKAVDRNIEALQAEKGFLKDINSRKAY